MPKPLPSINVQAIDVMAEAQWSFESAQPVWRTSSYTLATSFDPFPAYKHERAWVEETVLLVAESCPPIWNVNLYIADREVAGRTNAFSSVYDGRHKVDDEWEGEVTGTIMLSGKRTPIHPAVTRFVVAHEYGHNVEWMLEMLAGSRHLHADKVIKEYAIMRNLPDGAVHHGTGGRWHDSAAEIFADDFRILICNVEPEHWPHQGIAKPNIKLLGWWADALARLVAYRNSLVMADG